MSQVTNLLSAENLSLRFGAHTLFSKLSFGVSEGEKVALIGANGCGKSTFLKILSGKLKPDEGSVSLRKDRKVYYVSQDADFNPEHTVWQVLFDTPTPALHAIQRYEKALTVNPDDFQGALEEMDRIQAWDYEAKMKEILSRLELDIHDRTVSVLSGGQIKRLSIAKALLSNPDLLILDEPTNHLDLEAIEWLENYLKSQKITLILVTHDRYFLDAICTRIVELENHQLHSYPGNYGAYLEKKAERREQIQTEIDKAKRLYVKELDWIRRQPQARGTKAKYRVEAFEDVKDKAHRSIKTDQVDIQLGMKRQGKKILEVQHLKKSYDGVTYIADFSHIFCRGERIGIIGPNGTGKSTLLQLLTEQIIADKGVIDKGINTVFGFYSQTPKSYPADKKVIDAIRDIAEVIPTADGKQLTASKMLELFLFSAKKQYDFVANLSGGERRRLQLLEVLMKNPNFLILDEPTNDLDIPTLNVLEDFLEHFEGCLMIVTHDRYFMDRLTDHLFVFEGEGSVRDFPGNYSDYKAYKKDQKENEVSKPANVTPQEKSELSDIPKKTKLSYKEKVEFETIEKEISSLQEDKAKMENEILNAGSDFTLLSTLTSQLTSIKEKIDSLELRWLELSEKDN